MPSDSVLAEALARVEHKLDILLERQLKPPFRKLGDIVNCPVCGKVVEYQVDQINKVIVRKCGCKTGLQAPLDLAAFAPPALAPRKDQDHGEGLPEDGSYPTGGGRSRPR